jgi:hypothetical protein
MIPVSMPILASEDSVSIDPRVCTIKNKHASFITNSETALNPDDIGYNPQTIIEYDYTGGTVTYDIDRNYMVPFHLSDRITGVSSNKLYSYGCLDNIYISINKIIELYRSKGGNNPDGVLLIDYLKDLMTSISSALGGINDLQVHVDRNKVRIIDVKYLEVESSSKSKNFGKYNFDLFGLKSICRDVKISSRIFDSQATMIAIAAQNKNNVGDIYSSTQTYFNKGLTDRLLTARVIDSDAPKTELINDDPELTYFVNLWNSISNIAFYLQEKCIGIPTGGSGLPAIKAPTEGDVNNARSILKNIHLQINGGDVDYKALIPFELELTLDGISGMVVGQIFTIDKSILPKDYATKNLGFIITGINHNLQNNDWTTTLKTQCCLLDQEGLATISLTKSQKAKIKAGLAPITRQTTTNAFLAYAMTDFLFSKIIAIQKSARELKTWEFANNYLRTSNLPAGAKIPTDDFKTFCKKWINNIKVNQSALYNLVDGSGNKIFPQTVDDWKDYAGGLFNFGHTDAAFSLYSDIDSKNPKTNSVVLKTVGLGAVDLKTYFGTADPYAASRTTYRQTSTMSTANSDLFNKLSTFSGDYWQYFTNNILYVNSIFGRGLGGAAPNNIVKLKSGNFDWDLNIQDRPDKTYDSNEGLLIDGNGSYNIELLTGMTGNFQIATNSSMYAGPISGIERFLTERTLYKTLDVWAGINQLEMVELWKKLFEYVTKDFFNPNGGLNGYLDPAFMTNFTVLRNINGSIKPISEIYDGVGASWNLVHYNPDDYARIYP